MNFYNNILWFFIPERLSKSTLAPPTRLSISEDILIIKTSKSRSVMTSSWPTFFRTRGIKDCTHTDTLSFNILIFLEPKIDRRCLNKQCEADDNVAYKSA